MPLPKRNKGEKESEFISRCMSSLTEKGEGKDRAQRFAICKEQAAQAFEDEIINLVNASECIECDEIPDVYYGSIELYSTASEGRRLPKGRKLNKPFRTPKEKKKFGVYTKNDKGNIVLVRFGDPNMEIKRDDPERRKNFRARHNCDSPGPKWKARYWSCKMWEAGKTVTDLT